ncbi:exportin T, putative, partial [Entamoeba invadens IP1]
ERDFPVNSILYGKSTLNQMDFLEIHKIVVDHFLLYVLLFEKGEIENSMEFSSVITKIINSYFSDYSPITQQITQNSNDSVKIGIAGIYRGLFSSYKNVLKDSVDDDDAANVEKSLAAIYRAAASIDEQATILLQFLGEMLKVNECNCSVESVTCHSYFLLQFPDLLMNEENIKNVIVDNVNKFYIKALQVGTTVGTKCPVIPALTRFFMYLPVQSVMQIIDFCVQLAAHRKMVEEVKEALLEFRKLKDAVQPLQQWAVEMVKTTLVIDDTEWNTKKLSEHQDVYTIIGCVTSPQLLGDVIASLFLPQINKCNLAFTQPDVYFSTAYIGSRLSFCSTFLKTNLFFNKTEISKLFEGFCPVMLKIVNSEVPIIKEGIKKSIIEFLNVWVLALGDNFSVVPPLRAILGWFGTEAVDAMIVGSSVLQMVTKQEKIKSVIVNDEYCGVVQYFINSLSGIEHLNLGSELLHEKVETMGMVFKMINLPKSVVVVLNGIDFTTFISSVMVSIEKLNCFELAKQLSGYIVRSITLFIESNGVIGKNVGMNVWLMLFARLVLKTKNTKNFGMNMAVAECFRGILKVCVECNGFSKVLEQFVVSGVLGEQQQNFVVILQRVFALHPEQITTSKVMNILKV